MRRLHRKHHDPAQRRNIPSHGEPSGDVPRRDGPPDRHAQTHCHRRSAEGDEDNAGAAVEWWWRCGCFGGEAGSPGGDGGEEVDFAPHRCRGVGVNAGEVLEVGGCRDRFLVARKGRRGGAR